MSNKSFLLTPSSLLAKMEQKLPPFDLDDISSIHTPVYDGESVWNESILSLEDLEFPLHEEPGVFIPYTPEPTEQEDDMEPPSEALLEYYELTRAMDKAFGKPTPEVENTSSVIAHCKAVSNMEIFQELGDEHTQLVMARAELNQKEFRGKDAVLSLINSQIREIRSILDGGNQGGGHRLKAAPSPGPLI